MYWEDFRNDFALTTPTRRATAEDLDAFIRLSGLDNPIFSSREGASQAGHADRIVPAPLQLSIAMGLAQQAGLFDHVAAVLEFRRLTFHQTVHPGVELTLTAQVLEKRPTRRPDRGIVVLAYEMRDQDGRLVMSSEAVYMMRRRPAEA